MYFMISNEIVRKVPDTESRGFCRLHLPFAQARSSNSERSERSIFHQRSVINSTGLFAQRRTSGARSSIAGARPLRALVRPRPTNLAVFTRFHRDPFTKQARARNVIHLQTNAVRIFEQN